MKQYKTITFERESVVSKTCDICGNSFEDEAGDTPRHTNEVKITHTKGHAWPNDGGGETNELDVDVCAACFESKVLPALRSMGVKTEYKKTEF